MSDQSNADDGNNDGGGRDDGPRAGARPQDGPVQQGPNFRDNISAAWQGQPVFRLLVILLPVLAVAAIAFGLTGGSDDVGPTSVAPGGAQTQDIPGGEDLSPAMEQAILAEDQQRLDRAAREGDAFFPTPRGIGEQIRENEQGDSVFTSDPLDVFRSQLDEQQQNQAPQPPPTPPAPQQQRGDGGLADAMSGAIDSYLGVWTGTQLRVVRAAGDDLAGPGGTAEGAAEDGAVTDVASGENQEEIISAGEVHYAQMLTLADSSVPGPVLAEMLSGPLAGGRLIGTFTSTDDVLVIGFQSVVLDRQQYQIDAVALDPDTTLAGVATDVDRRYFERIILPAAARFIEGFGDAVAETATTTTVVGDGDFALEETEDPDTREAVAAGASSAFESVAEIVEENAANARPIVRVQAGTALGILFAQPVSAPSELAAELLDQ